MQPASDLFAEVFEERAAIHEHEAGLSRETAEAMARKSTEELIKSKQKGSSNEKN